MPSTINADNGVVSGSSGVKTTADTSGVLALQSNGTTGLTLNTSLALGVGSGNSTGSSGQVLTSAGSGAAPTWASVASSQWTTSGSNIYYNTGNVAVKTTTFSSIAGTVGTLTIGGTNANTSGGIAYQTNGTVKGYHYIDFDNMTHQSISGGHLFLANNTEQVRITSAGRLGVGTTTPASKFVVANGSVEALEFNPTGSAGGGAYIQGYNRTSFVYIPVEIIASSFAIYPQGGASKVNVNFNGLGLGTGTPSSGIGITFPATQDASSNANTLDDYEEGTFTPVIAGTTTAGTATYGSRSGAYTKIGNLVTLFIYIDWSAFNGTGNIKFTGFPFASVNTANRYFSVYFGGWDNVALTASYIPTGYIGPNETSLNLGQRPTGTGTVSGVPVDAAGVIIFTITYNTAD
jgi:hypothetical protein